MTAPHAAGPTPASLLYLRVVLPFACGHFLSNVFRSVNAVISGELQLDLGIDAADLGLLTSAYFLAFAVMQLPVGVLLDRYGPRRVEAVLLLVAAAGSVVFALGDDLATLTIGRALIGLGLSACLMASFKAFALWADREQLALLNGYMMAFGALGAVTATVPVQWFVAAWDWRPLFGVLALGCVACAALLWFAVPERGSQGPASLIGRQLHELAGVFRSRPLWVVAPAALTSHALGMAVNTLWAGPWLRDVASLSPPAVAWHLMLLALSSAVGFLVWATAANRLLRSGIGLLQVGAFGMGCFWLVNLVVVWQPPAGHMPLWMVYGFMSASGTVFYAGLTAHYAQAMAGRVNAAINLVVFAGAFVLQWGMGLVIQRWALSDAGADAIGFAPTGYAVAFGAVATLQGLSLVWLVIGDRGLRRVP